jgi:hypothetical protein
LRSNMNVSQCCAAQFIKRARTARRNICSHGYKRRVAALPAAARVFVSGEFERLSERRWCGCRSGARSTRRSDRNPPAGRI